jgi:hypothetical protein
MAPSTLPQLTDANSKTVSPNMTGIFLFDTHKIFRTHLLGSTFHPTPFTLISVLKFHSATLYTSPLYMPRPIWTLAALSPDKRSRICPIFPQTAKRDLVDSAEAIASNSARWNCDAVNIDQSSSIHEHPWASMSIHARASVPVTWISSSTIVWAHKEKCLAFSLALSRGSKFLLASLNGLAQSRKAKSHWGNYQISQEIL